ncbi:MAG TPA: helix-turn-helix domain-containing protein [Micromonosporaceae bacterium]|jgi:DNA-binding transcriptional ArsR family regulator
MSNSPNSSGRQVIQIDDAVRMRALSHPARLSIIEHLEYGATATATELAAVVGLSPSATSYHLRELARGGLIREAEGRGDGRERVWQAVADWFRFDSDDIAEDDREKAYGLLGALIAWQDAQAQRFYAALPTMPRDWQDASAVYGARIVATAAELADLCERIRALIQPFTRSEREMPEGAAEVSVVLRAMPHLPNGT